MRKLVWFWPSAFFCCKCARLLKKVFYKELQIDIWWIYGSLDYLLDRYCIPSINFPLLFGFNLSCGNWICWSIFQNHFVLLSHFLWQNWYYLFSSNVFSWNFYRKIQEIHSCLNWLEKITSFRCFKSRIWPPSSILICLIGCCNNLFIVIVLVLFRQ